MTLRWAKINAWLTYFFYKHMARLCLVIYDFEAHSMISLCLTFQVTRLLVQIGKM